MGSPISNSDSFPKISIGNKGAGEIWNAAGILKGAGGKKTRITIGAADDRFAIVAKTFERSWWGSLKAKIFGHGYVELKVADSNYKNKIILVKIDSLVKRLHLSKEQIVSASNKGGHTLLQTMTTALEKTEKAVSAFESSIKSNTGLKPENLMKGIKFALDRKDANPNGVLIQTQLKKGSMKEFVLKFDPKTWSLSFNNIPQDADKKDCDIYNVNTNSFEEVTPQPKSEAKAVPILNQAKKEKRVKKAGGVRRTHKETKPVDTKKTTTSPLRGSPRNLAEEHYDALVSQIFDVKNGELYFKSANNRLGLTPNQLKKIIDIALKNPALDYNVKISRGEGASKQVSRFLLHFDENEKLRFKAIESKALGEGAYGKVFSALDFETVEFEALKIQKKLNGVVPAFDDHEFKIVRKLQPDQKIPGIQSKPRKITQIKKIKVADGNIFERSTKFGIYAQKADYDYFTRIEGSKERIPLKTLLMEQVQMLQGAAYMHSQNVVHIDIKPENMLVTEREVIKVANGKKVRTTENMVDLADFGGAVDLSEPSEDAGLNENSWRNINFSYTPQFVLRKDIGRLQSLQKSRRPNAKEEFKKLGKACDAFALGVTLYTTFSSVYPFQQIDDMFYDVKPNSKPPELNVVPENQEINKAINKVLQGLLNPNPTERWDVQKALRAYKKIIASL